MKTTLLLSTVLAALLALPVTGCKAKGPTAAHERLTAGVEPLRTAFNADVGKVRVLMLAAPT